MSRSSSDGNTEDARGVESIQGPDDFGGVAVYIRRDRKLLADGSERCYVSLAHNVWEPMGKGSKGKGRTKPIVFAQLGTEDRLDAKTVDSIKAALDRYLAKREAEEAAARGEAPESRPPTDSKRASKASSVKKAADELRPKLSALRLLASVDYGLRVILEPVWERLGLRKLFERFGSSHQVQFDFERIVFGMVLNRLVDPKSKRACNEWLQTGAYFPEAEGWQVHHFYRALDLVNDHAEEIDAALLAGLQEHLGPDELNLLLLDTTSTYFESDYDDLERAQIQEEWDAADRGERDNPLTPRPQVVNEEPLRLRGHSKDQRPDKPQVVVGTVCTKGGFIVKHKTYPGNTTDVTVTVEMLEKVAQAAPDSKPVVVFDSGHRSQKNLQELRELEQPPDWICAVRLRSSKFGREAVLARPGRYRKHPTRKNLYYRVVRFEAEQTASGLPEMWIATRNKAERERKLRRLERQLERVRTVLAKDDKAKPGTQALRELVAHRTLKRFVKLTSDRERYVVDEDRVREERLLAGVRLIHTSLAKHDPLEILDGYQQLLKVEDNFRTFKGPLKLRPMHHRLDRRIKAHVTICVLALLCLREIERKTGLRYAQLVKIFQPVHAALVEHGDVRFWQRNEWSDEAIEVLAALEIDEGPRTWGTHKVPSVEGEDGR